jgi:hypothetical protein
MGYMRAIRTLVPVVSLYRKSQPLQSTAPVAGLIGVGSRQVATVLAVGTVRGQESGRTTICIVVDTLQQYPKKPGKSTNHGQKEAPIRKRPECCTPRPSRMVGNAHRLPARTAAASQRRPRGVPVRSLRAARRRFAARAGCSFMLPPGAVAAIGCNRW